MITRPADRYATIVNTIPNDQTVLIAGPTASGKSALALVLAEQSGGVIVNADASQVYECWRVVTARPSIQEENRAPHALYGHISALDDYSVGHWLRDVDALRKGTERLIIVGGTGLYFTALTQGLADIPPTPATVRARADAMDIAAMRNELDAETLGRIDQANRARVQRAWEVWQATGKTLAHWQDTPHAPALPLDQTTALVLHAPKEWLTPRIEKRFDQMIAQGALKEVQAVLPAYDPTRPAHRAIGVPELIAHLKGEMSLDEAKVAATIATRRFAKRQRTWFRSKMRDWTWVDPT